MTDMTENTGGRPPAMTLTDSAALQVKAILASKDTPARGVRIGVREGGCSGMSYTMEFADAPGPHDETVEDRGVTVFIEPKAIMFLIGTEMDYVEETVSSGFVFNNPNETGRCGCGESFTVD